ncbi:hypothetical protein IWX50DRAFT_620797 [Phyllosticta citricarpa]|uniref:Uncharacterized protein n=1 Tax=Phyllosticta citricarpa TaxID=55181 RepID=A0ABR1L5U7_9PEZI
MARRLGVGGQPVSQPTAPAGPGRRPAVSTSTTGLPCVSLRCAADTAREHDTGALHCTAMRVHRSEEGQDDDDGIHWTDGKRRSCGSLVSFAQADESMVSRFAAAGGGVASSHRRGERSAAYLPTRHPHETAAAAAVSQDEERADDDGERQPDNAARAMPRSAELSGERAMGGRDDASWVLPLPSERDSGRGLCFCIGEKFLSLCDGSHGLGIELDLTPWSAQWLSDRGSTALIRPTRSSTVGGHGTSPPGRDLRHVAESAAKIPADRSPTDGKKKM